MPRGNVKNLTHTLTVEEQRKGGIASGIARAERKTFREELVALLSKGDTQEKISLAVLKKALDGDTRAFELIRDTVGEKPTSKIEADVNNDVHIDVGLSDE